MHRLLCGGAWVIFSSRLCCAMPLLLPRCPPCRHTIIGHTAWQQDKINRLCKNISVEFLMGESTALFWSPFGLCIFLPIFSCQIANNDAKHTISFGKDFRYLLPVQCHLMPAPKQKCLWKCETQVVLFWAPLAQLPVWCGYNLLENCEC